MIKYFFSISNYECFFNANIYKKEAIYMCLVLTLSIEIFTTHVISLTIIVKYNHTYIFICMSQIYKGRDIHITH